MGKPKRSNKIRRQSSSNEHEPVGNASGGKFFGLLNLKNGMKRSIDTQIWANRGL